MNFLYLMRKAGTDHAVTYLNGDIYEYWLPYFTFAKKSVLAQTLPLWTPYQAVGSPLFAAVQIGVLYPFNWTVLFLDIPDALLATQFLNILIGVIGIFFYLRHIELEWPAVMLGSILFGYSMLMKSFHPSTASTFCWIPMLFWFAHRIIENPSFKTCVGLALILALSFLGGNVQCFYYMSIIFGLYVVFLGLFQWKSIGASRIFLRYGLVGLAYVLLLGLVAVQFLPTIELVENSIREVSRKFTGENPFFEGSSVLSVFRSFLSSTKGFCYFGGSFLMIGFALGSKRRRQVAFLLCGILIYTVLFVMSKEEPSLAVFGKLPLADSFRWQFRMLDMALFLIPVIAAVGLSAFWDREPLRLRDHSTMRLNYFWIFMIVFAPAFISVVYAIRSSNTGVLPIYPGILTFFVLFFAIVMMYADRIPNKRRKAFTTVLAVLLVSDVFIHIRAVPSVPAFTASETSETFKSQLNWVRQRAGHYRVLVLPHGFGYYNPNVGTEFEFSNINSFETFTLTRWKNYVNFMAESRVRRSDDGSSTFNGVLLKSHLISFLRNADMIGLASLRYLVVFESKTKGLISSIIAEGGSGWEMICEDGDEYPNVFVYENMMARPRAYLTSSYRIAGSEDESLREIKRSLSDPLSPVVLENVVPSFLSSTEPCNPGQIDIADYAINKIELRVRSQQPCLAILTDIHYPGWNAYVDGAETDIWRANSLFRAVEMAPGEHTVVFKYEPRSLRWGTILSLITISLSVVGLYIERRYRRKQIAKQ